MLDFGIIARFYRIYLNIFFSVLGTDCSEVECSLLGNSVCGDKNICVCEEGFPESNNVCSGITFVATNLYQYYR